MTYTPTLGIRIDRTAAADPQNAWLTIFAITGGRVFVTRLIGFRTVIQAGGASTMQFRHSVGPTVMDAGTLSVAADAANTTYYLTGSTADPIVKGATGAPVVIGKIAASSLTTSGEGFMMFTGNIQVTMTAAAGTGSTGYTIWYMPIDAGAAIAAA